MCRKDNKYGEEGITKGDTNNVLAGSIQDFYADSKILVTGATGFIGKALIEKLLRSCTQVSTIFMLIRPKKGLNSQIRHDKLLDSSIFDTIRDQNPELLKKLVTVEGDVAQENLGLSEADRKKLVEEIDVVFHSAATVRFTEKLKDAIELNTLGTIKVIELCREMKNLKAFVHVSTAYSNAEKYEVLETVYPAPCDLEQLKACCRDPIDKKKEKKLVGKHPNNYTMTKAVSEYVVSTQASDLPVAIVRPSIVTGAWKEPVPGWVDNVSGISGIMVEISRGTLRSIICDEKCVMDVIPVDIVVNTLIAAAWHTARHRSITVPVYNCTSGTLNPISWYNYGRLTEKYCLQVPSKYVQWYPGFSFTTNRFRHSIIELFMHFLPALFIDLIMVLNGMKPIMFEIAKKFKKACKNGEFFALHEWKFQCDNLVALNKAISAENDKDTFSVDIAKIEWDSYVRNYLMGLRKFVLKDDPETLAGARKKLHR
ncbi:hypothetical protein RUM44_004527 [Polyplax serrata]|uniref:Fatty acyl-CoA reductase n=1 Tax=Polyplax serrata TaxID=468196 RepID=A0ABR1B346_POLSC